MFRESSRSAPHNLYGYPDRFFSFGGAPVPPQPLFSYLAAGEAFAGDPVESFTVAESNDGGYNPSYTWEPTTRTWLRSVGGEPSMMGSGAQVAPTNVVVQFTTYDPEPGASGATGIVTGSGEVWVFTDGKLAKGTWTRPDPSKPPPTPTRPASRSSRARSHLGRAGRVRRRDAGRRAAAPGDGGAGTGDHPTTKAKKKKGN